LNGLLKEIPIRDYGIKRKFRERILSSDESTRLFAHLSVDSSLFWMVYFSILNPIRKMDLGELRRDRESLVLVGRNAPYMRFMPRKSRGGKARPCVLPNVDTALLGWFVSVEKEFPGCPYYFPRIIRNKRAGASQWFAPGNWRRAFKTVCTRAGIDDFHIHDLRHCAFTGLRRAGLGYEDIKALGMQATEAAIRVYDQSDAMDVLERIRARANSISSVSHLETKNG
jgi:integrase